MMKISEDMGRWMLEGIRDNMVVVEEGGDPFQLVIYGDAEPDFDVSRDDQTPLVVFDLPETVFGTISYSENDESMIALAYSIPMAKGVTADTATWFRVYDSENNVIMQDVLTGNITLNTTMITIDAEITVENFSLSIPVTRVL